MISHPELKDDDTHDEALEGLPDVEFYELERSKTETIESFALYADTLSRLSGIESLVHCPFENCEKRVNHAVCVFRG